MAILSLPDAKSPSIAVIPATQEQMLAQAQKNGSSWRGALSLEAYIRREEHLSKTSMCVDGGLTGWVLVDTSAKDPVVLSGCETLNKRALVSVNGAVQDVVAHGIGSVFCPVECRKRGYGSRMMAELAKNLEAWQAGDSRVAFSVLYSDIGKDFYNAHGWKPFPSAHVHIKAAKATAEEDSEKAGLLAVQPLFAQDLPGLCKRDEELLRGKLANHKNGTAVALIPDLKSIEWHTAREEFVGNELYGKKPFIKGAMAEADGQRAWCIWTRLWYNEDPKESNGNTMHILRLVVDDTTSEITNGQNPQSNGHRNGVNGSAENDTKEDKQIAAISALLLVARQEAFRWKMAEVELWNPDDRSLKAAQRLQPDAQVVDRDNDSITSLRWHGPGGDSLEWLENEKYAWC